MSGDNVNIFVVISAYHSGWQLEHFIFHKVYILFCKLADTDWKAVH